MRTCTRCGDPFVPLRARSFRCPACAPRGRDDRSPTTRAQDAEYRAERARVLTAGPGGQAPVCALRIRCAGAPATTVDHVVPVAHGGGHRGNLVPACGPCNASKQDRAAQPGRAAAAAPAARTGALRLV